MRWSSLERGEVSISYADTGGDGAPVVFLHGLAGSAVEFIPTAQALEPDFRSVLLEC